MKIDTSDMVSISDISKRGLSWYITEASEGRSFAVLKNSKVAAVITGSDVMEQMQDLDEREENLRLMCAALARVATDTGKRYSLEEVAREFEVDLDDENADLADDAEV